MIRAAVRADLPSGTVTFLFTDVEGSTRLLQELGAEGYAEALAEHRHAIREACAAEGGFEVDTQGDAFFFAFPTATGAVSAASALGDALANGPIQVRVGLHTGTPLLTEEGYVGDDVHLAARVAAAGHGGQVVLTSATAGLVDAELVDLGEHRLKDIDAAVALQQVGGRGFPPLKTISNTNLPRPASTFLGRERELEDLVSWLRSGVRLLTLTGPGGTGKTRLALEAASSLVGSYKAGVFWVGLASLRNPKLVAETIAQTLGAKDGLVEHIGGRELLLLLDNLEQIVEAAPDLSTLVSSCPNLALLVTSRQLLRVQGEVEFPVPPLAEAEAVALFCARSQLKPSDEIAELCTRLDSLPLAVELAAARTKALTPAQILERLSGRLDLLRAGRGADPRQQTLRATIEWSYELLDPEERQLFAGLSVFAGGCTLEAAEEVCDADLDILQSLAEKSLLRFDGGRYWMLETIREYAAERLHDSGSAAMRARHRAYVVALAESSAPLLHDEREAEESKRLELDHANIRAAVADALEREPDDAGRILGAVYPFLISRALAESRDWAEATVAMRDQLSTSALAEALAGAGEIARFAGELDRAIELKEELVATAVDVKRPNWKAAVLVDLCEIALERGDYRAAREYAERSAAEGGGARTVLGFAELLLRLGDLRDAEERGLEALSGFDETSFNGACALEILGEVARRAGDEAVASERFVRGLLSFAGIRDAGGAADCLDGLARIASERGDRERAIVLAHAALRLRGEAGRRPIRKDVEPVELDPLGDGNVALDLDAAVEYALASTD
jgi:predicted ATPase/class 3 adenylate cyclase